MGSSNINEVIWPVLNFFFFLQRDFASTKRYKTAYSKQKLKNVYKKHPRGKKLLIHLFTFCAFALLCFYAFSAFVLLMLLVHAKSFCKI